jgi:RHH-type proline utilization regulon transcriptional repressor/proline dehydrogenase/delta 1-pyrroline-5-carboxylate dehydrogenase
MADAARLPVFRAPFAEDDVAIARQLLARPRLDAARERKIDELATRLIGAIRAESGGLGGVDELLREYSLSTREGLALMVLAEALLRVPDPLTADRLIEDKLGSADFEHRDHKSDALLVAASAWALGLSARIVRSGETPEGILGELARRIGLPALRAATRQAMRVIGNHFVLGQTIEQALSRARAEGEGLHRYSFDMLGEGARTAPDAARYFDAYRAAIDAIGRAAGNEPQPDRPGISVKLSALHPRFEAVSRARVMAELVPRLLELAQHAKSHDLRFTIDAEEADRLELSLDVVAATLADRSLAGWDGFGIAVQAYQKRAAAVIDWLDSLADALDRRVTARLVKGAYWDSEIKRAQERGLDDYPVFTRKAMTDLNYVACVDRLLRLRRRILPQFATHNALTVATVLELAGGASGFEFQRLHGMGEALYASLRQAVPGVACRVYAPVGEHRDLLAYLVRRLLENGANSSFVSAAADPAVSLPRLLQRPADIVANPEAARHPKLPLPRDLFAPERRNSRGVEFGERAALEALVGERDAAAIAKFEALPLIDGRPLSGSARAVVSPIDGVAAVGQVAEASQEMAALAVTAAVGGFRAWSETPVEGRAAALERAADLIEARRGTLIWLLQTEGGKTIDDAVSEVREAVDFCRYYAAQGRRLFSAGRPLPGPTGEANTLGVRGRGAFVAISPWNFPLAIFLGQVGAALVSGNTVVAKPAEQTPLVAAEAVRILHQAGVPAFALHLLPGDGRIGAALIERPEVAGVVFTGSTEVAWSINRALAAKEGPIVPFIAETGGINAMIVDATALPEQVTDDVMMSAFRSAGQRCSALRLLCLQEDIADGLVEMIVGAARELKLGDPRDPSTHVGPVIEAEAKRKLEAYVAARSRSARIRYAGRAPTSGWFVAPHVIEIESPAALQEEVFGPILHVVRYRASELDALLGAIEGTGYGLTLGIESRIDATVERIVKRLAVGNVYVNRSMIGAVVGSQPFGGHGLSGTGPKAGGPQYLLRFVTEQTVSINTAAAGGNASLLTIEE